MVLINLTEPHGLAMAGFYYLHENDKYSHAYISPCPYRSLPAGIAPTEERKETFRFTSTETIKAY